MDDKVMINFYYCEDGEEPKRVCYFSTLHFAEWLKALSYAKKYDIEFLPREDDEKISNEIIDRVSGIGCLVDDFCVSFGSDDVIQCINVYLR